MEEELRQFLSDTYEGGDWTSLVDYINQHYISKKIIREGLKKEPPKSDNQEEKKAIKWLKELYDIEKDFNSSAGKEESNIIKTLLNLIEKQQKEIEELKEEQAKRQWVHIKENGEVEPLFYISKEKIKELIKEIQETMCPMCCECGLCEEFEKILEGE